MFFWFPPSKKEIKQHLTDMLPSIQVWSNGLDDFNSIALAFEKLRSRLPAIIYGSVKEEHKVFSKS